MAIRTGKQYIDGLRDSRQVFVNGVRVEDVTTYPAFRRPIEAIARLYDLKHDPSLQRQLTYLSPTTGNLCDICYLLPQRKEDIVKKREAYKIFAKENYGAMGRSPEFMNAFAAGLSASKKWFGRAGKTYETNVQKYYEYVRENDLFLTHALGTPQTDRSKPSHQQKEEFLHLGIKEETSEGVIIRGAKQLSTNAPFTDELLIFPNGRQFTNGDEKYCVAFAVPVSSPGLKLLCRETLVPNDKRNLFDHPLSSRFEEIDAMVVCEDVFVPWNRVFFYKNLELANTSREATEITSHCQHQSAVRAVVKAGLAVAIAKKITDSVKTDIYPQVGEKIGNIIAMMKATESLLFAAEQTAIKVEDSHWKPNQEYLSSYSILFPKFDTQIADLIRSIGAAGLMLTPTIDDFLGEAGEIFDHYFAGAAMDGISRVQIAKLAWDFIGDSNAQRVQHYERFHSGEPMFLAAGFGKTANVSEWLEMTEQLLEEGRSEFKKFTEEASEVH